MIKVVLVDDHIIVRSGFSQILSLEEDIAVVGEFGSAAEARRGIPPLMANVCILDISMPDESGLSLLGDLADKAGCIMLSVHDSVAVVEKSLKAGARGYLSKRCNPDELIQAVRTVSRGGCYLTPDIAVRLASPERSNQAVSLLTKRERQVSELLSKGLDVKSVAHQLGLSPKTVHVHRANAMDKLGVKNNVELARLFNEADNPAL
ncbi:transcriptional regulator UhpA [Endozoicomonas sp. Mp262]|uniref:transcriptional regulator UhpA n=1 Tax=Endozoicomonas sp. Mp262 TaxID=2919499 RepID=UPI0021D93F68